MLIKSQGSFSSGFGWMGLGVNIFFAGGENGGA